MARRKPASAVKDEPVAAVDGAVDTAVGGPSPDEAAKDAAGPRPEWRGQMEWGDYHRNVVWLRTRLGMIPSRVFDRETRAAVAAWQADQGWRTTGRVDRTMWSAL